MTSGMAEQKPSVVVTSRSFGSGDADPVGLLEDAGLEVVRADTGHDHEALKEPLAEAVAWIAGTAPIESRHLDMAPRLKIVARYGAGTDSVDVAAASERDIVVTNTPGANTEAVADHASRLDARRPAPCRGGRPGRAARRTPVASGQGARLPHHRARGLWEYRPRPYSPAQNGFGSRVLVHDPYVSPEQIEEAGAEPVDELPDLASAVDLLSLHLPGGAGALIDEALLGKIRPGMYAHQHRPRRPSR